MTTINNLSGLDKAGLLFQMLGESLALTLFNDMTESDLLKIRIRSKELKLIEIILLFKFILYLFNMFSISTSKYWVIKIFFLKNIFNLICRITR